MKPRARRLVLFDIDGTLLSCQGIGKKAMLQAIGERAAVEFDRSHPIAGKTDRQFIRECLAPFLEEERLNTLMPDIFSRYVELLSSAIFSSEDPHLLPGVLELIAEVERHEEILAGLLTGNIERGARIKLARFGLEERFAFGAFGDDGDQRRELPPIALARARAYSAREFLGAEVIIIGDTPNDIDCGRPIGARTIAVATGGHSVAELAEHEPDLLFESLARWQSVMDAILD